MSQDGQEAALKIQKNNQSRFLRFTVRAYPIDYASHGPNDGFRESCPARVGLRLRIGQDLPIIEIITMIRSRDKSLQKSVLFA